LFLHVFMKYTYRPKSSYEKFSVKVYNVLAENFPQTYFVGGMIRDLLLGEKITDIDLATSALPEQVRQALGRAGIACDLAFQKFGVVQARQPEPGKRSLEITTFRQDLPAANRWPEVRFVKSPRSDSRRRDFTVNALYYKPGSGRVLDFHDGLADLKKRQLKFIGLPVKRITEDPLRIIRALRFCVQLNFKLESKTASAIGKCFYLTKKLSRSKIEAEISKLRDAKMKKTLRNIINSYPLDA
jgi:tRNA nucleotidyltransferase/poly(A) polymerase